MKILKIAALTFMAIAPLGVAADDLDTPTGEVILTVSGAITKQNTDEAAAFDFDMLAAMPAESFETTTIWTEGSQSFTGVSLNALLDFVGVDGKLLFASAINDYQVEIPITDATDGGPIVAYLRNGEPMSVRNKGPLWIVYPYDLNKDYQSETIYSRSIWQLDRIEVVQ
ncbi:molybdopterin-dependent oxidoreductase [Cognatishimia activa]|uniref:Oxidoreductase molybdopterin binding domain protein n=1 Tax=Cognatishimia activa TaxID=1715691 RepID=A0A0P1IYV7_9RHOB|nr:molybdopterin-dependent oxidoreductase [Cognatishimia activa]CUI62216.1 Oxidoreductase molybdopterin binding domain protein [Cognatishimia activa]CUK26324.1 Oxidoreductase molybdopterin binding domain protein [Cognatishimia activa]